jgi:hypothetical protein
MLRYRSGFGLTEDDGAFYMVNASHRHGDRNTASRPVGGPTPTPIVAMPNIEGVTPTGHPRLTPPGLAALALIGIASAARLNSRTFAATNTRCRLDVDTGSFA